uniref:Small ribosomal subunit protein uS3 n=1 Tax=Stygiella incarcerata TaxID=1712417 RepID=A0A192ZHP0_9EUKA|nr:40S ribosomal protein S3-1 [Stygiella incarcerata]
MSAKTAISKKKKFVARGVFYAELNEFLKRELQEDGYTGVEVHPTPEHTKVIIRVTRPRNVLGEKNRRIRELTSVVQKRFGFKPDAVQLFASRVAERGLSAAAQAESLRFRLTGGMAVRRACFGVVRQIKEAGAVGCEVAVSGKLRAQRGKTMKFKDGFMISSGNPVRYYIDTCVRKVHLRQGVLGVRVSIMLPHDKTGERGPTMPLPDFVDILEPKIFKKEAEPEVPEVEEIAE